MRVSYKPNTHESLNQGSGSGSGGPEPDFGLRTGLRDGFQKTSGSGLRSCGLGISGLSPRLARFSSILKIQCCRFEPWFEPLPPFILVRLSAWTRTSSKSIWPINTLCAWMRKMWKISNILGAPGLCRAESFRQCKRCKWATPVVVGSIIFNVRKINEISGKWKLRFYSFHEHKLL